MEQNVNDGENHKVYKELLINFKPLQYSGLENFMDCIVHRVTKSLTRLSDFHFISLFTTSATWAALTLTKGGSLDNR